jgi:hypothetical protein
MADRWRIRHKVEKAADGGSREGCELGVEFLAGGADAGDAVGCRHTHDCLTAKGQRGFETRGARREMRQRDLGLRVGDRWRRKVSRFSEYETLGPIFSITDRSRFVVCSYGRLLGRSR